MPNMKQGTLSFTSAKRTTSLPNGKKISATEKGKSRRVETPLAAEVQHEAKLSDVVDIPLGGEGAAEQVTIPVRQTRASTKTRLPSDTEKQALPQPSESDKQKSFPAAIERAHLDVEDKAGRYRKYYTHVRSKMGYVQPVHSEEQNKIHQMLRFFDMSYEFGPCIGMTRLERWERAEALGLDPPPEVREILLTKTGIEKAEYAQCVLHDEV